MLAVLTGDNLHWVAPNKLKNPPDQLQPTFEAPEQPLAAAWSVDNTAVFVAHLDTISKCNPDGVSPIFCLEDGSALITHLVCTDKPNTVIFSSDQSVFILDDVGLPSHAPRTLGTHKLAVRALSLSNDNSLLISIAADAAHIHNLTTGLQTILRGLPLTPSATRIGACAFHQHARSRVLLGIGRQLAVYETLRPSSPAKVMATGESDISFISCSPFSKTLVAVCSTTGVLTLVDLEREKSIIQTKHLDVTVTSLTFSPEGGYIYVGTDDGKLLVLSLRDLDSGPKSVALGASGARVVTLAVQRKSRSEIESRGSSISAKSTATATSRKIPSSRAKPSASSAISSASTRFGPSISAATSLRTISRDNSPTKGERTTTGSTDSANNTPTMDRRRPADRLSPSAKVLTPSRDPLSNRGTIGNSPVPARRVALGKTGSPIAKSPLAAHARVAPINAAALRVRSASGSSQVKVTAAKAHRPEPSRSKSTHLNEHPSPPSAARPRSTTTSLSEFAPSIRSTGKTATTKPSSSTTPPRSISRTPSPEFPTASTLPETPLASKGKARAESHASTRNLLAPPVDVWDSASAAPEGRKVGFLPPTVVPLPASDSEDDSDDARGRPAQPALAMQVSPRRPSPATWQPSPLRGAMGGTGLGAAGAQDLLRSLVRDALADVRQESRAELVGLRLDLLNLGRGWKKELREGLGELTEEVKLLREENERLREENARLKRGY